MKKIHLTESQFKKICNCILKEEEYTATQSMGVFNNPMEAQQCADLLKQNNIEAYVKGNEVVINSEKDFLDDNYMYDNIKKAQQIVQQFNNRYRQVNESK